MSHFSTILANSKYPTTASPIHFRNPPLENSYKYLLVLPEYFHWHIKMTEVCLDAKTNRQHNCWGDGL